MSAASTPLISNILLARYLEAVNNLNQYADDPRCGGSVEDIKKIAKRIVLKGMTSADYDETIRALNRISPGIVSPQNDLVALLIRDNRAVWDKLLNNKFCQIMGQAKPGDKRVTKGFKWYMIQDFFYCTNLLIYDTERAKKSRNAAEFKQSAEKIISHTRYAGLIFDTCTVALGIREQVVLKAKKEKALLEYSKFGREVGANPALNWVSTLVLMIPCIQSYYQIALKLSKIPGIPKDTPWYKYWIAENASQETVDSVKKQIAFFIKNEEDWRADYKSGALGKIFRDGCNYEISLWAVGENPGPVS